ncbi:hypothetical protein [Massilia sp. Dwa41.01b]|uniref:hypothetical protein n=1 Tax=Massilia sp. Dwa41.01b TaxID=2709302 RepID=UPI001E629B95|nr:hypothetical protein [Massilia sp. Dwa41.01b]
MAGGSAGSGGAGVAGGGGTVGGVPGWPGCPGFPGCPGCHPATGAALDTLCPAAVNFQSDRCSLFSKFWKRASKFPIFSGRACDRL